MIDYAIVAQELAPFVQIGVYEPSPFKTHRCLDVRIAHGVLQQQLCKRVRVRELPVCMGPDLQWGVYLERAFQQRFEVQECPVQMEMLIPHTLEHLDQQVSVQYILWYRATEFLFASRACAAIEEPYKYHGR